jgi:hypothetical protein
MYPKQIKPVCWRDSYVLIGSGSENKNEQVPSSPMTTLWALHPVKGHVVSQVMAPWGMPQKCHKADKQEAFTGLCVCSCRDMLKGHSTPDSWLPSPTKRTKEKTPLCKQQRATDFLGSLSISRGSFSFLSKKSYFMCWPCGLTSRSTASRANSLARGGKNSWHRPATLSYLLQHYSQWPGGRNKLSVKETVVHIYTMESTGKYISKMWYMHTMYY